MIRPQSILQAAQRAATPAHVENALILHYLVDWIITPKCPHVLFKTALSL